MDDRIQVQKALQNSDEFSPLVVKYEKKIDTYIKGIIYVSVEDREDILQEVFLAAYRFLNSYNPAYSFSTWLYRIAHNQAMSFLRKHKMRLIHEFIPKTEEEEEGIENLSSDEDVERRVMHLLEIEQVKDRIDELSPQDRAVLILRFSEEKEYAEIASILRVPEGTVASLIHRAKVKLKKLLNHVSS